MVCDHSMPAPLQNHPCHARGSPWGRQAWWPPAICRANADIIRSETAERVERPAPNEERTQRRTFTAGHACAAPRQRATDPSRRPGATSTIAQPMAPHRTRWNRSPARAGVHDALVNSARAIQTARSWSRPGREPARNKHNNKVKLGRKMSPINYVCESRHLVLRTVSGLTPPRPK